jgi:hypothetical protein
VSPNLLTERDVDSVVWHTWPEGDGGPSQGCGPSAGDVAEEGGVLSLSKGVTLVGLSHRAESTGLARGKQTDPLLYLFRTATGRMNQCRSFGGSNCNCTENAAITRSTTASSSYDHNSHLVRCLTDTTCLAPHFCWCRRWTDVGEWSPCALSSRRTRVQAAFSEAAAWAANCATHARRLVLAALFQQRLEGLQPTDYEHA